MSAALTGPATAGSVCLAIEAMATRFELALPIDPDHGTGAAGV
jgi:hypothetical protein